MLVLPAPQDVLFGAGADLAVRAGTDAEIVAEGPVVEVVRAAVAGARVGADLVLRVAGLGQQRLAALLHVPGVVVLGHALRRSRGEHGVRFQGELVVAQVGRLQRQRLRDVALGLGQGLLRQRVHQVQVDIGIAGVLRQLHRTLGLGAVVDAAQPLQGRVVEALDAEAQAIHPGRQVAVEAAMLGGAGVGLQGDLQARREAQPGAGRLQEAIDRLGRKQAGRTAAEEHAVDYAAPDQRQVLVQVADQRIHIGVERQRALGRMRIEIAVRAFAHAPGQVHVERQRWRHQRRGVGVRGRIRAGGAGRMLAIVVGVRHGGRGSGNGDAGGAGAGGFRAWRSGAGQSARDAVS
ncbi:hypothetical protein NB689_002638 [Xanthomonas sacchari]|nr:hypothetical protein [Xanthomonas sacchari]